MIETPLLPPRALYEKYPLTQKAQEKISSFRKTAIEIFQGKNPKIALLVGPCSIHNIEEVIQYAKKLKELQKEVDSQFFLILRAFLEKPRSGFGWKGFLYDPNLDGSSDIQKGVELSRKLLLDLLDLEVPVASELLDPIASFYYSDLLTWAVIGARTAASQPHRQLASTLSFPVGFKNTIHGELEPAIHGISVARRAQSMIGINKDGFISSIQSVGNPFTHLILRGSHLGQNCDLASIEKALRLLNQHHLEPILGIDCSHGNSGKDLLQQKRIFQNSLLLKKSKIDSIRILMLESYLEKGSQPLQEKNALLPGISITDPCLSWHETSQLVLEVAETANQ